MRNGHRVQVLQTLILGFIGIPWQSLGDVVVRRPLHEVRKVSSCKTPQRDSGSIDIARHHQLAADLVCLLLLLPLFVSLRSTTADQSETNRTFLTTYQHIYLPTDHFSYLPTYLLTYLLFNYLPIILTTYSLIYLLTFLTIYLPLVLCQHSSLRIKMIPKNSGGASIALEIILNV